MRILSCLIFWYVFGAICTAILFKLKNKTMDEFIKEAMDKNDVNLEKKPLYAFFSWLLVPLLLPFMCIVIAVDCVINRRKKDA